MKHASRKRTVKRGQRGYALLMIMFFLAILVLSMAVATPTVINDLTREKEAEMVWRGKQYVRGVRLYYQKMHRFPTELDDLTKPKTIGVRFMRQAYKDPMNTVDGSWRLIYLGPGGMLIGSLKTRCLNATLTAQAGAPNFGNPVSSGASSSFGSGLNSSSQSSSFGGSSFSTSFNSSDSSSSSSNSTASGSAATACGGATTDASGNPSGSNQGSSDAMGQPHDITSSGQPQTIVGGSIIGVGSKVDKQSFLWYDKARNYRMFEFVWDPTVDTVTGRRTGTFPGQFPGGVTPGTVNPAGTTPQGNNPNPAQTQNPPMNPNAPQGPPLQAPTNP
jgi:hypothetical protein